MLSDIDLKMVQDVAASLKRPVTFLIKVTGSNDPFESNLINIARQVSGVSLHRIGIEESDESVFPDKPSLTLSNELTRNIHYLAAPEGPEFGPFLDAVSWLGHGKEPFGTESSNSLASLTDKMQILVLIAPSCTHCPQTVRNVMAVSVNCSLMTVTVVDAIQFSDLARKYKVKSTPTVIIDEGLTLVGHITLTELVAHLKKSYAEDSLTEVLESMINAGRAEDAATLLCNRQNPAAIIPIYRSQSLASRIGALLVMEEALQRDPSIFHSVLDQFTAILRLEDVSLRGDTAELLGKMGNPAAIPDLLRIADDPDTDVREAVREALDSLQA